jgi:hypothetical protein
VKFEKKLYIQKEDNPLLDDDLLFSVFTCGKEVSTPLIFAIQKSNLKFQQILSNMNLPGFLSSFFILKFSRIKIDSLGLMIFSTK